jgi:hypothetical protein
MPRRLPEELEGKELRPLCIAVKTSEAEEIEAVLDRAGIDYTFEITAVAGMSILRILFGNIRKGVMFLVPVERHGFTKGLLEKNGLSRLLVD